MAEFAETKLQETVAEVEEIERLCLLTKPEIRELIEKRREYEYRLARRSKNKDDYINSINYEKKLLELLKIRRKQIRMHEKFKEIEGAIFLRVMKRCRYMTRYWPHHLDTWKLRISYAQQIGWKSEISTAYAEQIGYHGDNASLYVLWAKYEIEVRHNFDSARKILLSKAALYHSESLLIKKELVRLELLYVEYLKNKIKAKEAITEVIEEKREKILKCEIPRAVYRDSVKAIPDPQLYFVLYEIVDKFSFAHHIREEIYKDLCAAFPNSDCVFKLKARRTVMGIEDVKPLLAIDKLNAVISIYDEALEAVQPSFLNAYVDELMLMLHESWSSTDLANIVFEKLLVLFKRFSTSLQPLHCIIWYQIVCREPKSNDAIDYVLYTAVHLHPDLAPLQVEFYKRMLEAPGKHTFKIKKFESGAADAKDAVGVMLYNMMIDRVFDRKKKMALFINACEHKDDVISKAMRVKYLDWINNHRPIRFSRALYKEYCLKPPYSTEFHATMAFGELKKKHGCMDECQLVFENAVQQHGKTLPGLWLTYIFFEKYAGSPLKAGALYTRAESILEPKHAEVFRQLNTMAAEILSYKDDNAAATGKKVLVTGKAIEEEKEEFPGENSAAVQLFEEKPTITYSVDQSRKEFFSKIMAMMKSLEIAKKGVRKEDGSEWEAVLEKMLGERIPLTVQVVTMIKEEKPLEEEGVIVKIKEENKLNLTDMLNPGPGPSIPDSKDTIEKILETSLTIKPEFLQQTQLQPYFIGKAKAKAERRKERSKTKGPGWYDMKAPEMTPEVKRELEVLQMRPVLDPKRPFKNKDMQVLPKYFQLGKIIDAPVDFYSSRISKKKRKRTMAEEILNDEDALRYQKRKYNEIIAKKQKKTSNRANSEVGKKMKKIKKIKKKKTDTS